jgi:hypothetical protein
MKTIGRTSYLLFNGQRKSICKICWRTVSHENDDLRHVCKPEELIGFNVYVELLVLDLENLSLDNKWTKAPH